MSDVTELAGSVENAPDSEVETGSGDREKWLSIGHVRSDALQREKTLDRDMSAYRRLRDQGLQPPTIDGCDRLEKEAVTRDEIVTGAIVHGDVGERKKVAAERRAAFDRAREFTEG